MTSENETPAPAFGDPYELQHVCDLLEELRDLARDCHDSAEKKWSTFAADLNYLSGRLRLQEQWERACWETIRPGKGAAAFDRSYVPGLYFECIIKLADSEKRPATLVANFDQIVLLLHKLMIEACLSDQQREAGLLKADAITAAAAGKQAALVEVKKNMSNQARSRVKNRGDQKLRVAFVAWGKGLVMAGNKPANVKALMLLDGFQDDWKTLAELTLKRWAKEAGFVFQTGRPKKISSTQRAK